MKKRGFTLLELLVVLAIFIILAAILVPVFTRKNQPEHRRSCQSNLKQIGLGFLQYSADYAERFPPVALNDVGSSVAPFAKPYGWADAIQPYIQSLQVPQCSSEKSDDSGDARLSGFTDYWMNSNAAGHLRDFDAIAQTILCGDGNDGKDNTNARYNKNDLPQSWRDDEKSPAFRHLDVANYLFVDGHVKAFRPDAISIESVRSQRATFSVH